MNRQPVDTFERERTRLNDLVLSYAGTNLKRLWHLDGMVYKDGALPSKTKELLGLVASLVLRCDDCVRYHIGTCFELDVSDQELEETITIALTVGGSITIPHIRRAIDAWDKMKRAGKSDRPPRPDESHEHGDMLA